MARAAGPADVIRYRLAASAAERRDRASDRCGGTGDHETQRGVHQHGARRPGGPDALIEALRSGQLLAAGLDVYDQEPVPADLRLLKMDNVLLQPHVAWLTPETLDRSLAVAMENCRRLRDGEELLHRVL